MFRHDAQAAAGVYPLPERGSGFFAHLFQGIRFNEDEVEREETEGIEWDIRGIEKNRHRVESRAVRRSETVEAELLPEWRCIAPAGSVIWPNDGDDVRLVAA